MTEKEETKPWPPEPRDEAMENTPESAEVDVSEGDETGEHKTRKDMQEARREGVPSTEP